MGITVEPFWGDLDNEMPQEFIKAFNRSLIGKEEKVKIEAFPDFLGSGSIAEEWYEALTTETKASWALTRAAFAERFPKTQIVAKTVDEYEDEMLELTLVTHRVGGQDGEVGGGCRVQRGKDVAVERAEGAAVDPEREARREVQHLGPVPPSSRCSR